MVFYPFLGIVILKLFYTDMKIKTKRILWPRAANSAKSSEVLKQYLVISWLTYWNYNSVWWTLICNWWKFLHSEFTLGLTKWNLTFPSWYSQQSRDIATSGRNRIKFQLGQSYSYIMRKVWCHQIWIRNNFGLIVLIQGYIPVGCSA